MMLAFCLLIRHLLHGQEMALKLLLNIDYFFKAYTCIVKNWMFYMLHVV